MISEAEFSSIVGTVLVLVFGLGVMLGAIGQGSHYCTMGAVSDWVNMGHRGRMRMVVLSSAVATILTSVWSGLGLIDTGETVYTSSRLLWASHLAGGLMFGFGMVLASGCGSKTMFRLGSGSLRAWVVLGVMAASAFMTIKGLTGVWRVNTVDSWYLQLPVAQDLPSIAAHYIGNSKGFWSWVLGLIIGFSMVFWSLADRSLWGARLWWGGIGIGAIAALFWLVTGYLGYVEEHPETLEQTFAASQFGRMEGLSYVAPASGLLDWLLFYSDTSKHLHVGIAAIVGTAVGSFLWSVSRGVFRWEGFSGAEDTANHLIGAMLMGVGGVVALGCTVGQGLTGFSTLSIGSFIAVASILAGASLGIRYQVYRVNKQV